MSDDRLSEKEYTDILERFLDAWNKSDAGLVASFYTDDLEYRDPTVPQGIFGKDEMIKYLKLLFQVWPIQRWAAKNIMPHEKNGAFSADYDFEIANDKKLLKGTGMDRIEFRGNKVRLNHVYLNAEKWKKWIGMELKQ